MFDFDDDDDIDDEAVEIIDEMSQIFPIRSNRWPPFGLRCRFDSTWLGLANNHNLKQHNGGNKETTGTDNRENKSVNNRPISL